MSDISLDTSIQYVKGVGPKLGQLFAKKGIATFEDALFFLPRAYEDRRILTPIANLRPGTPASCLGKVVHAKQTRVGRKMRAEVLVRDPSGSLRLSWFHAYPGFLEEFAVDSFFLLYGDVKMFGGIPCMSHPEFEKVERFEKGKPCPTPSFGRVLPIYSETEGLHQKMLRKVISTAVHQTLPVVEDPLPEDMRSRHGLPLLRESFRSLHFPPEIPGEISPWVKRIAFEEFFVLQLGLGLKKRQKEQQKAPPLKDVADFINRVRASLPFELTGDQAKVLNQIQADLIRPAPMTRLVQGDVGSGKTAVALLAAAAVARNGYQTILMAPTEILAQQHLQPARSFLTPHGIQAELLVQSTAGDKDLHKRLRDGTAQVIVGAHAVFQESVQYKQVGLVIVDEQHRFGVDQRNLLIRKAQGWVPHLLMMTATPIPRTLSLTLYGDLDLSLIREKPKGRQKIETRILPEVQRPKLYQTIRQTVARGEQVYVIYPLIEASEKLDLKSATEMHARLDREIFPDLKVALLHGRMKPEEKENILQAFKAKKFDILISTTVIEVGIDVATATLMVIEHPERLGLSQLHQLRGRVGRGELGGTCILVCSKGVTARLSILEKTEDGFEIAEHDLKIRGPGEFLGVRQSGLPGFRVGHILRDADLLEIAKEEAEHLLNTDPQLKAPEHQAILTQVKNRWKDRLSRLALG